MISEDRRQALALEIDRVRGEIVEGLLEEMYQNPFWEARYGERGRRHTRQDTNYHLNYLVAAIQLNHPASLVAYYHWCQGLLVYRGMCTLHLHQTIDSLGHQLARLLPDIWPEIEPVHNASYAGLNYDSPGCQALVERQEEIARRTTERMFPEGQRGDPGSLERRVAACHRDNLFHLSYLADSVAYQSENIFVKYVDWLKVFFPTHKVSLESLFADLRVLDEEIKGVMGEEQAAPFHAVLNIALQSQGQTP